MTWLVLWKMFYKDMFSYIVIMAISSMLLMWYNLTRTLNKVVKVSET